MTSQVWIIVALVMAMSGCSSATHGGQSSDSQRPTPANSTAATPAAKAPPTPAVKSTPPSSAPEGAGARGAAFTAFEERIRQYVKFHNNVVKMVPPLRETSSPDEISQREAALGAALIKQRPDAKEGDFFIKEVQPHFAQIIKQDFAKRSAADRKALVFELPKGFKIGVNTVYPTTLPLLTFPGNLLEALPQLPRELEYRIVGRHLVLRDTTGNIVVDILRDVFPM